MLDPLRFRGPCIGPPDGDDVEPSAMLEQLVAFEISQRRPRQPLLFIGVDSFGRVAGKSRPLGLDLDEHDRRLAERFPVQGDQVDFAAAVGLAGGQDPVAFAAQQDCRRLLASFTERSGGIDRAESPAVESAAESAEVVRQRLSRGGVL